LEDLGEDGKITLKVDPKKWVGTRLIWLRIWTSVSLL